MASQTITVIRELGNGEPKKLTSSFTDLQPNFMTWEWMDQQTSRLEVGLRCSWIANASEASDINENPFGEDIIIQGFRFPQNIFKHSI